MAPQMGLIGFYIAQGYKIAYMALLGPFWPVGILLKRYNEVILYAAIAPASSPLARSRPITGPSALNLFALWLPDMAISLLFQDQGFNKNGSSSSLL